ncbi:MAG: siphovirus Gp157 family protein [Eubacterium sp.]
MNLYEIDRKLGELLENGYNEECVNQETGEFFADKFEELLARYEGERSVKIENIALFIKNLDAESEAIKVEEKRLADRRKAKEKKAKYLKEYLTNSLTQSGETKFESAKCALSFRKSVVTVVDDISALPKQYVTEVVDYVPDKTAIKKALQAGEEITGAKLEEKQNLQIK